MCWVFPFLLLLRSYKAFCQLEDDALYDEYDAFDIPYTVPQLLESTTDMGTTTAAIELNTLFPLIGAERRQIMNWEDGLLIKRFVDSGRNKTAFISQLRREFSIEMLKKQRKKMRAQQSMTTHEDDQSSSASLPVIQGRFQNWRPPEMTESVVNDILNTHNNIRSTVDPTADEMWKLSWDYTLEASAFHKVSSCKFSGRRSYSKVRTPGENLWIGWGVNETSFNPSQATSVFSSTKRTTKSQHREITTWLKEKKYFDPRLQLCLGGPCEYYVQLIWYPTYKVGCAWTACENVRVYGVIFKNSVYLACHYGPRGIKLPFLAYYKGPSCSFCPPQDKCERRLCSNAERETTWGSKPWIRGPTEEYVATVTPEIMTALLIFLLLIGITCAVTALILITAKLVRLNKKYRWCRCPNLTNMCRKSPSDDEYEMDDMNTKVRFKTASPISECSQIFETEETGRWV